MALFTTLTAVLAAKCTLSYLTECIIDHSSGIALKNIPKLGERLKKQFADTQPEVNGYLQKAILSSHWMATLVFVEQMHKKHLLDEAYNNLYQTVKAELKKLQDKDYHPDEISPDAYDAAKLIKLPKEEEVIRELRASVMQFHLEQLDKKTGNIKNLADYSRFTKFIQDGWAEEKLSWYALMAAFLNQLLKGDNNNAKDSFQNQTLAEIKLKLEDFEKYAGTCVQGIGEERFRSFEETLFTEIAVMQESLTDLRKRQDETFNEVLQVRSEILELKNRIGQTRQLDLNLFEHYRNLQADTDLLKMEIEELEREKKETLEFIREEENERKRVRFEKDYASLEAEQLKKRFAIDEKQKELNVFSANIQKTWLSVYAESSPRLMQAREALEAGNLDAANRILDIDALQHDADLIEKLDAVLLQKKESLAQEFMTKANLTLTQKSTPDWFELCDQYYAQAVKLCSSFDTHYAYGNFLENHNQYNRVEKEFQRALEYIPDHPKKALVLDALGRFYAATNEVTKATKSYQEALTIYREYVAANPHENSLYYGMAMTIKNLGQLQLKNNERNKSKESFLEALEIDRKLAAEAKDETDLWSLAGTLTLIGNFYQETNEVSKALESFEESLKIRRFLAKSDSQGNLPGLANTLNSFGNLQYHLNDFSKAEECFVEALDIFKKLAESNPQVYFHPLGNIHNCLGAVKTSIKDYVKAKENYEEAVEIFRKLAEANPQVFLNDLAMCLNNIGELECNTKDYTRAKEDTVEALRIYRELAESNPQIYLSEVANTLRNLGKIYFYTNELDKAKKSLQESLEIVRKLAEENPHTYIAKVGNSLHDYGHLQQRMEEYDKAEDSYTKALEIYKFLAETNPQAYLPEVDKILSNLAIVQLEMNELDKAKDSYKEVIEIRRKRAGENPQPLATVLYVLGLLLSEKNEYEKAEENYKEALEIRRKLAEDDPQTYLPDVASTLHQLGNIEKKISGFTKGKESYSEALEIWRKLVGINPETYLPDLAETLNNLGDLLQNKKEYDKAEENYKEALEIKRKLVEDNSQKSSIAYAITAINLANLYRYDKINKDKSVYFARLAIQYFSLFSATVPDAAKGKKRAEEILEEWASEE